MGFFGHRQKESEVLKKIRDLIVLLETRVSSLEIQLEGIIFRLRKKVYKENDSPQETKEIDDGFDELRRLNKL